MKRLRAVFFWAHLATGVLAGTSASIVALTSALFPFAGLAGTSAALVGVVGLAAPIAGILFAVVIAVIAMMLGVAVQPASAQRAPRVRQYANCTAMHRDWPHGVAR